MSLVKVLFFLVLLLNQLWSPPLRLQTSHCSTFRIICVVPSIAVFIIIIIIIIINFSLQGTTWYSHLVLPSLLGICPLLVFGTYPMVQLNTLWDPRAAHNAAISCHQHVRIMKQRVFLCWPELLYLVQSPQELYLSESRLVELQRKSELTATPHI